MFSRSWEENGATDGGLAVLDFLLNHSPVFVGGEVMLAVSLIMFGAAAAVTVRERYSIKVPMRAANDY